MTKISELEAIQQKIGEIGSGTYDAKGMNQSMGNNKQPNADEDEKDLTRIEYQRASLWAAGACKAPRCRIPP